MKGNIKALRTKPKSKKFKLILFLIILTIVPFAIILFERMEGEKPAVEIELSSHNIGLSAKLTGSVSDIKSGIRKIWVAILKDGAETVLFEKTLPPVDYFRGGKVKVEPFVIVIEPKKLGISDGKAVLRIGAWDYAWRGGFKGNNTYIEKEIVIDTTPPEVEIVSNNHKVIRGGTGLVIYKVSEPDTENGVVVGDKFFPGHSGYFKNPNAYIAFFAVNHRQGTNTKIYVKATDISGNSRNGGFSYVIWKKTFKRDTIRISDRFLKWKMPQFEVNPKDSLIKQFLRVNSDVRKANSEKITSPGKNPSKIMQWEASFLRLPGSSNRAGFADYRKYIYKGRVVDHQYHLGIDLASIKNAKVPASNNGIIAMVKNVGIYGKTVVIDHGFGLFSTYSHLNEVYVKKGDIIKKGGTIGRTGITGLTGGDHLHYGIFVYDTFVNPVEWWDGTWIERNITRKLETAKLELQ